MPTRTEVLNNYDDFTEEIWKDIPGYEGRYQASNRGRVKNLERKVNTRYGYRTIREKILKQHIRDRAGHLGCSLGKGSHNIGVHRAVAMAFHGLPPDGMEVLHINGIPTDNRPENLRYGTQLENILDVYYLGRPWKKLTIDDVEGIRFGLFSGHTYTELAAQYEVAVGTIRDIDSGRRYSWLK